MSQENIQVVAAAFEAALQGDAETATKLFAPDSVYTSSYPAHLPFSGEARGPAGIVAKVQEMSGYFERLSMDIKDIVTQGDSVVGYFEEEVRAKATDKRFVNSSVLWAKVRDGQIYAARTFADSFAVSESLRVNEAPKRTSRPKKNTVKNALKAATKGKAPVKKNTAKAAKKGKAGARKSTARARG